MPKELTGGTPLSRFKQKIQRLPGALRIMTEGDSWFAFPLPSRPNIPDNLITTFAEKAAWLRLEGNGDEAVENGEIVTVVLLNGPPPQPAEV